MPQAPTGVRPPSPGSTPSRTRDPFLDLVRAVATLRVIVWHAFSAAFITFTVAAMPAMFFVTGSLYAGSVGRRGARHTLLDRLRRIAPSLWLFAAVAWLAMAIGAARSDTPLDWWRAPLWLVPIGDPGGSVWEGGWLATPLWYLRTLLWLFALAPLVIAAVRRWPVATFVAGTATVVALEAIDRAAWFQPAFAERIVWQVGDLFLYALFFAFGVRAHDGGFARLGPRHWLAVAAIAAIGAALWFARLPVPLGVVNNSHPMHLLVGLFWLALALAAAPGLRTVAASRAISPVVRFMSQRSLTVYLWHTTAIVVALWVLERVVGLPPGGWTLLYVAAIAAGTVVAAVVFGWLEDLGARRSARSWPLVPTSLPRWSPAAMAVGAAALVLVAATWVAPRAQPGAQQVAFRPAVPSQAPPKPQIASGQDAVDGQLLGVVDRGSYELDPVVLQQVVDEWAAERSVEGASIGVSTADGASWVGTVGVGEDGALRNPDDAVAVQSVTKLFTANLVYRAVDAGLIELDSTMPPLAAYPEFTYADRITPRQLLSHRSGLLNYWDSPAYEADPTSIATPADAIAVASAAPLTAEPGTSPSYSSTNYLVLGGLLEQVTGRSYDDLLQGELVSPLGLRSAVHLPPAPGEPRWSTGGLLVGLDDLTRAGRALLRDHVGVSDAAYAAMNAVDAESGMGAGLNGYCPCRGDESGAIHWYGLGYAGGHTLLLYLPDSDLVVATDVTGSFWSEDRFGKAMELIHRVDDTLRASSLAGDVGSA